MGTLTGTSTATSTGTLTGSSSGLVPGGNARRVSACSSSGASRPGSSYTASGEDTTTGAFVGQEKKKGKVSVRWGGVIVGGDRSDTGKSPMLDKEKQKAKEEAEREKKKCKEREKAEKKERRGSAGRTIEGRRRTPVTSVFPGLAGMAFGRGDERREKKDRSAPATAPVPPAISVQGASAAPAVQIRIDGADANDAGYTVNDARGGDVAEAEVEAENAEWEDDEEACVRIAVHATIPPFFVRGRDGEGDDGIRVVSGIQQPSTLGAAQQRDVGSVPAGREHVVDLEGSVRQSPPPARPRLRPVSEQLLGGRPRPRPRGIVGDVVDLVEGGDVGEGEFVLFGVLCIELLTCFML